jgi:glycosyltransferase involved in cell wall biosynthesis
VKLRVTGTMLNAGKRAARCVQSVLEQEGIGARAWTLDLYDAASTDRSVEHARGAAKHGVRVHEEETRTASLFKLWRRWSKLDPDDVIVWLDGDDALATPSALRTVLDAHERGALVTYGQFIWGDGRPGFAAPVGPCPRAEPWRATHLKTFRAGLVQRLTPLDLMGPDGDWYAHGTDRAVMLPLLELAGPRRSLFIDRVLYVYSRPSEDERHVDRTAEAAAVAHIHGRPPLTATGRA